MCGTDKISVGRDALIAPGRNAKWLLQTLGNTAQFPPCGLSTAPAAAALRIMRYCLIFYYIKVFSPKPFFQKKAGKKGWKAPVNNHFAGQRLSAGIMAQRAAESFSVIFMWRQLGR